jgi:3-oxoacyl-[acyl-carrier protein] reductase
MLIKDRVALVTGAGRGIGQAIAQLFVEEGACVIVNDLEPDVAAQTVTLCEQIRPDSAQASIGSVADAAYTAKLMKSAVDRFGKLDILINNAGMTRDAMAHRMSSEDWQSVIDVNLTGTFNCIRAATPYLRDVAKAELEETGQVSYHRKIVNFYSTAAINGNIGQLNYVAAKMGNLGISRTLAREWARFRINVNTVAPGFTDTRLTQAKEQGDGTLGIPNAQRQRFIDNLPFGQPASAMDVARVVLFFASPLSDWVTGQELNTSGGHQIP